MALLLKTLPSSIFTGIQTFPITAVDWLWRWWPVIYAIITIRKQYTKQHNRIYSIIYKCISLHLCENKVVYKHNQGLKNDAKPYWPNRKFVSDLKSLKTLKKLWTCSQILEEISTPNFMNICSAVHVFLLNVDTLQVLITTTSLQHLAAPAATITTTKPLKKKITIEY